MQMNFEDWQEFMYHQRRPGCIFFGYVVHKICIECRATYVAPFEKPGDIALCSKECEQAHFGKDNYRRWFHWKRYKETQ